MKKKDKLNYAFYDFFLFTAGLPLMVWCRPKHIYETKKAKEKIKGGAIVIANHSGLVDPLVLAMGISYRRHHFVATTELFNSKLKRFMFEHAHCIEIDRQNVSMQSFNKIIEHLNAGRLVSMFPEGRMTKNEEVQTFKSGMVLMALRANVPIIPVYIKRRKNYWQRQKYIMGEPINPVEMVGKIPTLEKINQVTNLLKEKEAELKRIADQYK